MSITYAANTKSFFMTVALCASLLAGCADKRPVAYQGLDSTSQLTPNSQDKTGHIPFSYSAPDLDWSQYHGVILDPIVIYAGGDQQFGKLTPADKQTLADYMQTQFAHTLSTKYALTSAPGPDILRMHVTLTGADRTTPVLGTVQQIMPVGAIIRVIKSANDKQSKSLGSVTYAIEIYDSRSNRLLRALVTKQYPAAENIRAGFGALKAAELGIDNGAKGLLAELQ
jgi:hypothetical protein